MRVASNVAAPMMRFQFPPDNPADAGPTHRSRLFERFVDLLPVVTYASVLWCASIYLLFFRARKGGDDLEMLAIKLGAIDAQGLADGQWWRMITSAFMHFEIWHVFFNMYWLVKLGSLMERGLGSLKTAAFICAAAFVSSTYQLWIGGPGIGFSGVVFAMGGFMWGAWPRYTGFLEGFNGQTLKWFLIWQGICFLLSFSGALPIGNTAHISGLLFGFLLGMWAHKGTKNGWHWLAASVLMAAGSVVLLIKVMALLRGGL